MPTNMSLKPNPLEQYLEKPAQEFTKQDIIKYIEENGIKMLNFRYIGGDGKLKCLNFVISGKEHLDSILSSGERVDGSSLFQHIDAQSSDLYVVPRYRTAYLNPFAEIPTMDLLCSFFDKNGDPLESSPEYIMQKAVQVLKEKTGFDIETMGELEYYIISPKDELYLGENQHGYHESTPFAKWEHLRTEAMYAIAQAGGKIKYGHSEVGNFTDEHFLYEQNEIEFLPTTPENAADQLLIAKWILRTLAAKYNVSVTFAPKISIGKAGSGLHIHSRLMKEGKNQLIQGGHLTEAAYRMIAGYLTLAPSLTAFGNTTPTSYFRLVPNHEAPTTICWGDQNRSALVRVPLGWTTQKSMALQANPLETENAHDFSQKQTIEIRSPDGSANVYLLMAGLAVAARHGFEMEDALKITEEKYVRGNVFHEEQHNPTHALTHLPQSCHESALRLDEQRAIYEKYGVFDRFMIDGTIKMLRSYQDENLRNAVEGNNKEIMQFVRQYFHCG